MSATDQIPKRPFRWHILVFLAPAVAVYTIVMILPLFGTPDEWMGFTLLAKPTESFAHDLHDLEENFIDRMLGEPGRGQPLRADLPLIVGDGLAGRALAALAEQLQRLETHLSLRGDHLLFCQNLLPLKLGNGARIALDSV